jgi:tripartite ATP-independent transporter DctM subunit
MMPIRVMDGVLSEYILAAVPLFIFMGNMMSSSGVAEKAFRILHRWMSGVNGGLAVATVILAMMFAATTGVVGASETAIGLLAVPTMLNARYSKSLASGCVCAGGTLGILIPPSIMLILYAPMAGVSVLQMFAGAVIPGLLLGASYYYLYFGHNGHQSEYGSQPAAGRTPEIIYQGIPGQRYKISFPAFFTRLFGFGIHFFRRGLSDRGRCRRLHRGHAAGSGLWTPYLGNI